LLYLILSIVFTSYLTLSFKVVGRFGIPVFQAIVFNYITCVITGSLVNASFPLNSQSIQEPWFGWALTMSCMFISIFNLIGFTAQKLGVAVASVSNKLSLVIPFVFSIYLYNETATWVKIAGILLALVAVVCTCLPGKEQSAKPGYSAGGVALLWPAVLFLSSGLLDTLVKYVQQTYLNESNNNAYLITAFLGAATLGSIALVVLVASGRMKFHPGSILAGIAIGIPNYFSIWALVKVLKQYEGNSSAILPINNMGIVLFSSVVAWLLFRERLSLLNWLGIVLSIAAIALIAFG
jgi:drug/metabolite transporter (DMT)-like permease